MTGKATQKPQKAPIKPKRSKTDAQNMPKKSVSKKTSAVVSPEIAPESDSPAKMGRPTDYNEMVASMICERISKGESLNKICEDDGMPSRVTVYNWLFDKDKADFFNKYTHARQLQAETFIDQCTDIADGTAQDVTIKYDKDGNPYEVPNHEYIQRSKLRVETRLKLAEKLYPKKYTPGFKHTVGGESGGPIEIIVKRQRFDID